MKNSIYGVAYLLRKTSMTLGEIRALEPDQFKQLYEEVTFQESEDDYRTAFYLANILTAIVNTVPRQGSPAKVTDFLNVKEPQRAEPDEKEDLKALAARFKVKLPEGG